MKSRMDEISIEKFANIVANSYSYAEVLDRFGYSRSGSILKTLKNKIEKHNISVSHFKRKSRTERTPENIFVENSTACQKTLRKWYLEGEYTPYKCSICGQKLFWNGKELSLTLDHISGVNSDDRLENLRWVCLNWDRQLDTFGSKNWTN